MTNQSERNDKIVIIIHTIHTYTHIRRMNGTRIAFTAELEPATNTN